MKSYYIFLLSLLFLNGCSDNKTFQLVSWKAGQDRNHIAFVNDLKLTDFKSLVVQTEQQEFARQSHYDFPVANSFLKKVYSSDGQLISLTVKYLRDLPALDPDVEKNFADSKSAKEMVLKKYSATIKELIDFKAIWNEERCLVWEGVFFDNVGRPLQVQLDEHLKILNLKKLHSSDFDRVALIFPWGPKLSQLEEIPLKNLKLAQSIQSDQFTVKNLRPLSFDLNQTHLAYSPDDPHFDSLQVFYYVDHAQNWIQQHLGLMALIHLDIELNTGYPNLTNAAFYYSGNIRLGSGDGMVYERIAQDASIVMHEVFHSVVESLAHLPHEGDGGSLNEAFADFFTSQVIKRPYLGESAYLQGPYRRNLAVSKKWSERTGALYGDSLIISSLFWELSEALPANKILAIAVSTLNLLNPSSQLFDFNVELQNILESHLSTSEYETAKKILTEREFPNVE